MNRKTVKIISLSFLGALTLLIITGGYWLVVLNEDIKARLKDSWFLPSTEIYSAPEKIRIGQTVSREHLQKRFSGFNMRERNPQQKILDGDWAQLDQTECSAYFTASLEREFESCFVYDLKGEQTSRAANIILLSEDSRVVGLFDLSDGMPVKQVKLLPHLFAQYYDKKPVLRRIIDVGETPLQCLQAITAIEDSSFLEHKGVSISGTLRAVYKNLVAGRYAEGGSTITQQLVKNYFLSGEKTLKRKVTEQLMAILLEYHADKDTILENYLNVIYMGANGPFQVRGFGAASNHYFRKPLENLSLPECALLAALVNSPGKYNPFRNPENAKNRRDRVLERMHELNMIERSAWKSAASHSLPEKPSLLLSEPAPYFVQAVLRQIRELKVDASQGLKVYTTLNVAAQEQAQQTVYSKTQSLEDWFKHLQKIKKSGKDLQASLISIEVKTGEVLSLVGGRSFHNTQFNRVLDAKRQVGSTMKPFVYLAALETVRPNGETYHALTPLQDAPFTHRYDGQSWSPKNYASKYYGQVPMYFALKNSLNTATAKLALDVGLDSVVDVAKRFGIESNLKALPSISLGAFEITPWELAKAYTAIARMGSSIELSLIQRLENSVGKALYQDSRTPRRVSSPEAVAVLISFMKQTLLSGTAASSRQMGFQRTAAGKTGTTSESKDAWFVGFTPEILTIAWVGYDDNTSHGLTGASGALPLWADYMNAISGSYPEQEFEWPDGTHPTEINASRLGEIFNKYKDFQAPVDLLFRSQDEPFED